MNFAGYRSLFIIVLTTFWLAGCGEDAATPDSGSNGGLDFGNPDQANDISQDTGPIGDANAPRVPAAPIITSPAAGDAVGTPLTVAGLGAANAAVSAVLSAGENELVTTTSTVDDSGEFSFAVGYDSQPAGTEIRIAVTLSNEFGSSMETVVVVVQGGPPSAPVVTSPEDNAEVVSPVRVSGTGQPGAEVEVILLAEDESELGTATGDVNGDGDYTVSVAFAGVRSGAQLTIEVVLANEFGASDPTLVSVTYLPRHIAGTISQLDGVFAGTDVYVQLFTTQYDFLYPLQDVILTATEDAGLPETPFDFTVAAGTYYLRAFRDSTGPFKLDGSAPDGYPTMDGDAQSGAVEVVVSDADQLEVVLELRGYQSLAHSDFNVFTSDTAVSGGCGGSVLIAQIALIDETELERDPTPDFTAPMLAAPDRTLRELKDDGACEDFENESGSFDDVPGDGNASAAWRDPDETDSGVYLLHYRDRSIDFVNVEAEDFVVSRLSRLAPLVSPSSSSPSNTATPTITFTAPEGGTHFWVRVSDQGGDGTFWESGLITETEMTPDVIFSDDTVIRVDLQAWDAHPWEGEYNATANALPSLFLIDTGDDSTISVSGRINNPNSIPGSYLIEAESRGEVMPGVQASLILPNSATEYELFVLRESTPDVLNVFGVVDHLGVFDFRTYDDTNYSQEYWSLDGTADRFGIDLEFSQPLILVSPENGATVGAKPIFLWQDYGPYNTTGEPMVYELNVLKQSGGEQSFSWFFPPSVTSFDFNDPPPPLGPLGIDKLPAATCWRTGGNWVFEDEVCDGGIATPSVTDLSSESTWYWTVVVYFGCDWSDMFVDADEDGVPDFAQCMIGRDVQESILVSSEEYTLTVE